MKIIHIGKPAPPVDKNKPTDKEKVLIKRLQQAHDKLRNSDICLIEQAVQDEIDRGVPEEKRTKVWYISCSCKKCKPHFV